MPLQRSSLVQTNRTTQTTLLPRSVTAALLPPVSPTNVLRANAVVVVSPPKTNLVFTWTPINPPWGMNVEQSTNLVHWSVLMAVDSTKGIATNKMNGPMRFYRLSIQHSNGLWLTLN